MIKLSQGYALLYSTVKEETQVDKVLILKGPNEQVAQLLKDIAAFAVQTQAKLDEIAKADGSITLDLDGLPVAETLSRDSIRGATSKQVLFSAGRNFEFNILLTQHEALNYIHHLAGVLGEQDTDETRRKWCKEVAEKAKSLHERVIAQLKGPYTAAEK